MGGEKEEMGEEGERKEKRKEKEREKEELCSCSLLRKDFSDLADLRPNPALTLFRNHITLSQHSLHL